MDKLQQLIEWIDLDFNSLTARAILAKAREIEAEKPVWTPTEGEEIEVSQDRKLWVPEKFLRMDGKYFSCRAIASMIPHPWEYARPLTVEKEETKPIELPLEYNAYTYDGLNYDPTPYQIQELTKSLREVIEAVNLIRNK